MTTCEACGSTYSPPDTGSTMPVDTADWLFVSDTPGKTDTAKFFHRPTSCRDVLAGKLQEATGCIKMLLRCATPNAKDHPVMWDTWGDAAVWLGDDRNRYRIPHVDLHGGLRASGRVAR